MLQFIFVVAVIGVIPGSACQEVLEAGTKLQLQVTKAELEASNFVDDFVTGHLPFCFVVRIRNTGISPGLDVGRLQPLIDINLEIYSLVLKRLVGLGNQGNTRFQHQCILYHLLLDGYTQIQLGNIISFFKSRKTESRNHESFLLVEDHGGEENDGKGLSDVLNLITHSDLQSYEHKAWIQPQEKDGLRGFKYKCWNYCYFCKNGEEDLVHAETFSSGREIRQLTQLFPDVTSNFYGRKMKFTAATALPFVAITRSQKRPKSLEIEGMQGTIAHAVAGRLNFSVQVLNTSKGLTGLRWKNGTWTGSVAEVLYGRSNFGLNTAVSYGRYQAVDFTVAATYGFLVLIATKPSPFFEWRAIFYPFEIHAWLGISFVIVSTILAYKFLLNHGVKIHRSGIKIGRTPLRRVQKSATKWVKVKLSLLKSCYITIGSLLDQGIPFRYTTHSSRVYAVFWFLFAIVTTCAYKSKLFSYLTFPVITTPPTNFYELQTSDYTWGLQSLGGLALLFITTSPVQYIRQVGEKMEKITDPYNCLDKTFTHKFVCINYKATFDYMSAVRYWKISHRFHVSDYVAPPVGSSWVLPKYSPLIHPLNKIIQGQFETGLGGFYADEFVKTTALKSRALAQASTKANQLFEINTNYKENTLLEKPLEFENLYASFVLLLFGALIASAVLVVEWFRWRGYFWKLGACITIVSHKWFSSVIRATKGVKIKRRENFIIPNPPHLLVIQPSFDQS